MAKVYLSLGSNLGDRAANLERALSLLNGGPISLRRVSSIYDTSAVGVTDSPDYLNCAAEVETELTPRALLQYVKELELELGRLPTHRWGPRVIDIDILLYDDVSLYSAELTIPHPRMWERRFVLIPLLEMDSEIRSPDGRSAFDLLDSAKLAGQTVRKSGGRRSRGSVTPG